LPAETDVFILIYISIACRVAKARPYRGMTARNEHFRRSTNCLVADRFAVVQLRLAAQLLVAVSAAIDVGNPAAV